MSVIQTIRNKYGKIAGAVIAIALVGFIVSDARNGSFGNFFGGRDSNVMKIDGTKIDPKEYQVFLKEYETLYMMFNKGRTLDDATRAQMDEQVVQMMVYQTVAEEQCKKLGIETTEEEKKDMIYGENADPIVKQFQINGQQVFINPQTNQFDPQMIKQLEKAVNEEPQKYDPNGKIREQWESVKSYVQRMSTVNKFDMLFTSAVYTPSYVAKRNITDQNSLASIRFVKVPYTTVADNDVKVSDDELKAYIQKHAAQYETDQQTRSMEYVSFDINPSSADTFRQVDALMQIKGDFATTKEKDNKAFVNNKSDDVNSFSEAYLNKRTFLSRYADSISALPVGAIYGPYYENGGYRLTKIVDRKTLPDSVKSRHILVKTKYQGQEILSDSAAKMRIDSAIAAINAGASFDSMVARYSDDDGSKQKGGEYTWTLQQRPNLAKEYGDFIFEGKQGERKMVKVKSDGYEGYHYIEILEQKGTAPAVQLATITKNLAPSDSTVNAIYGKANEFAGKNPTAAEFDATASKQHLDKRVGDNIKVTSFSVPGLGPAREVIRWMYDHKVGDISGVFQLGEQRYVVAKLTAIQDKGLAEVNAANRPMLEQKVKEEKKAEIISKKYAGASIESIAQGSGQQPGQSDSVVLGASYIPGLGYEPKVVGYSFCPSVQPNTVSPGIKGQGGIYFISLLNHRSNPADPNMMQMQMAQMRYQQDNQTRNVMNQVLQQAVIRKADVKYNADNF